MKRFLLILLAACTIAACYSKDVNSMQKIEAITCLKATVWDTCNLDCRLPLLSFEEDSVTLQAITNNKSLQYIVKGLPANLNVKGKKLCVKVIKLPSEEEFPCALLGLSYPHLKVISAEALE